EFPDLEDFRPAVRADALDRRATVFHRHLFRVFDLDLLTLFDAVTLRHERALLSQPLRGVARVAARWIEANVTQPYDASGQECAKTPKSPDRRAGYAPAGLIPPKRSRRNACPKQ